jgi:hypothetical protein
LSTCGFHLTPPSPPAPNGAPGLRRAGGEGARHRRCRVPLRARGSVRSSNDAHAHRPAREAPTGAMRRACARVQGRAPSSTHCWTTALRYSGWRRHGRMHSRNLHVNERIRTALKAAGIIVGYDQKYRRCGFKVRHTSSTVTKCPECGFALWVSPVEGHQHPQAPAHDRHPALEGGRPDPDHPEGARARRHQGDRRALPPPRHAGHTEGARRAPPVRGPSAAGVCRASHVSGTDARNRQRRRPRHRRFPVGCRGFAESGRQDLKAKG